MSTKMNKSVQFRDLGLLDYQLAWDEQERLFAEVVATKLSNRDHPPSLTQPTSNYLLFCQHPPVYTMGKSGKPEHLLLDQPGLDTLGASFYRIHRGGDITFHGPGQLVGYPIFDLENFFTDIHRYMRLLEEAVIRTCADMSLDTGRIPGLTGVWLGYREGDANPRKICAMGVRASRWVTMHGFALNVNTDLRYFDHIVPCGIADKAVTSMARELGVAPDFSVVAGRMQHHMGELFEANFSDQEAFSSP
ncbi:MAG: lipoyl(octanoyl) transferase LipB [Sphingobacteriaceae bacterium]|nr:lipoyl(octanoyl) transferase LipB [Cytophagaceae bacterium]